MQGRSNNYRHTMVSNLRRYATQAGVSLDTVKRIPKSPAAQPREVTVPEPEFERVLRVAPPYLELILLLAHEAGLRAMTAARLTRGNVDFDANRITGKTKGGVTFDLPLTKRLRDRLLWFCAAAPDAAMPLSAVYRQPHAVPTPGGLRSAMKLARDRASLTNVWGLHDLRRTAARRLYEHTHDIRKVQSFLGHKMLWTTCWYLGNAIQNLTAEDLEPTQPKTERKLA